MSTGTDPCSFDDQLRVCYVVAPSTATLFFAFQKMACKFSMKSIIFTSYYMVASASIAMSAAATGKIDVHAHYVPDFYATALREAGFTPGPEGLPATPVCIFLFAYYNYRRMP